MIMVLKKNNIIFIVVIFILSLALIGINNIFSKDGELPGIEVTPSPTIQVTGIGEGKKVMLDSGHGGYR